MSGTMMDVPLTLERIVERAEGLFKHVEVVSRRPTRACTARPWGR